jgi:hypothetical protein
LLPCTAAFAQNVEDSPAHRHQPSSFRGLAFRHENQAFLPIEILNTHPVEFTLISHPGIAHQYDDVTKEVASGENRIGYQGDDGLATAARLSSPHHVALDSSGNLLIADSGNSVIRKVTASSGVITTVGGNGLPGYSGDNGPATEAMLNNPKGLVTDSSGDFYVADTFNNVVRKVTVSTGLIVTVAGNGALGYGGDNGPATSAALNTPYDVAVDASVNVFIADTNNDVVREVTASSGVITTIAGIGNTPG